MLLTSGEDHRGVIWSGSSGDPLHSIEFGTPNFEINWSPLRAGHLACSSLDGHISVYNINDAGPKYCPKYLQRDCGVSFGFGGKIISFGKKYASPGESPSNSVGPHGHSTPRVSSDAAKGKKTKIRLLSPQIDLQYIAKEAKMLDRAQTFQKLLNTLRDPNGSMQFADHKVKDYENISRNIESKERDFDENDETKEINRDRKTWQLARLMYDYNAILASNAANSNKTQLIEAYKESMLNYLGYEKKQVEDVFNAQS